MRFSKSAAIATALMAILIVATFASISARAATSQSLPASCGQVGASSPQAGYTRVPLYPVVTSRGTVITVTTTSDTISGDVSSVAALLANPGPSGLSLREAITATNNNPGVYTIDFASNLKGDEILIGSSNVGSLPFLSSGNVIINGEIGDDTRPDITLVNNEGQTGNFALAFGITSSGNAIEGFGMNGFGDGVMFAPLSNDSTYSDNVISHNVIGVFGIGVDFPTNAVVNPSNLMVRGGTHHNVDWIDNTVQDNNVTVTLTKNGGGAGIGISPAPADDFVGTNLLRNKVTIVEGNSSAGSTGISLSLIGDRSAALNTLVADNRVVTGGYSTFIISTVGISIIIVGNYSYTQTLTIEGNTVTIGGVGGGTGIEVSDGAESSPYTYHGSIGGALILDNTINGPGIQALVLGQPTGSDDSMQNIYVLGNQLNMSSGPLTAKYGSVDFFILGASGPFGESFRNNITDLYLGMNTLILTNPASSAEDILLSAGASPSHDNLVTGVYIFNNYLDAGGGIGLAIWGGWSDGPGNVTSNIVSDVEAWCNLVPRLPSASHGGAAWGGISIEGGQGGGGPGQMPFTTNNTVEDVLLSDNMVAGALNAYQIADNLGPRSSGNVVRDIRVSPLNTTVTETGTVTSTATSTTTATSTVTSTSTAVSAITSTLPPVTTTITGPSSTTTSTTTVTTTAGGGVPEFPYQLITITLFTALLVASYLIFRHDKSLLRHATPTH